jgi:hypothetical protein
MAESSEIARLREQIRQQRERLAQDEPVEPVVAEPVVDANGRPFDPPRRGSAFDSVVDVVREHPALAIGVGAALMVAGPRRSLRLARGAMRGGLFALAAWRGVSSVLSLVSSGSRGSGAYARPERRAGRMRRY